MNVSKENVSKYMQWLMDRNLSKFELISVAAACAIAAEISTDDIGELIDEMRKDLGPLLEMFK